MMHLCSIVTSQKAVNQNVISGEQEAKKHLKKFFVVDDVFRKCRECEFHPRTLIPASDVMEQLVWWLHSLGQHL